MMRVRTEHHNCRSRVFVTFASWVLTHLNHINNSTARLMLNNIDSHYSSCSNARNNLSSWPPRSFSLAFQHFDIIMQKTLQHKIQNYWDLFKLRKNESKSLSIANIFLSSLQFFSLFLSPSLRRFNLINELSVA